MGQLMDYKHNSYLVVLAVVIFSHSEASSYQRSITYHNEILLRCPVSAPGIDSLLQNDYVDVWQISADGMADIRLNKDMLQSASFVDVIAKCTKKADIETLVQRAENMMSKSQLDWFEAYHRYEDIVMWYKNESVAHSALCKYNESIGKSVENRDIPALHISKVKTKDHFRIYFQCQIHGREWISGATCMYIADYLLENYQGFDDRVTKLLDQMEFIFIPFVNPDGYEYTWTIDRLWRKNRRVNKGSNCVGVDLNRNYPIHWGESGSSNDPCSQTYHGTSEASEPETQITINYFKKNSPIVGAIDWHSYHQLILRPYGWTKNDCPDEAKLDKLGDNMAKSIYEARRNYYTSMKAVEEANQTTGTASDWFYSDNATKTNGGYRAAGYTISLRDTGEYGFLLPPDQIIPTGVEIVEAVLTFAETLLQSPIHVV